MASTRQDGERDGGDGDDELDELFKSPTLARPSTPPPKSKVGSTDELFKTPTHPTPSHRPITRSISRSIRSIRSIASPSQILLLERTPTKTPRLPGSASRRRSPRNHQGGFEVFDTPISRTISQMLSEGNGFGGDDLDFGLPAIDGDAGNLIDFGNLLSTDVIMPSSPPKEGSMSFDYHASSSVWAQWDLDTASSLDNN
jgi:hypothetical protein